MAAKMLHSGRAGKTVEGPSACTESIGKIRWTTLVGRATIIARKKRRQARFMAGEAAFATARQRPKYPCREE
jgi:hypothetical protein